MRYRTLIPTLIIAFIMQLSIMNLITIYGVVPNLLLCLVLIITLLFDNEQRIVICILIMGILLDFAVGKYVGIYALVFFVSSMFTVVYKQFFNYESKISIIPLGICGTFIYNGLSSIILAIIGMKISLLKIITFSLIGSVLNLILMFIIYVVLIKKATARPKRSRYERYEII